jgi:hypothetical protein
VVTEVVVVWMIEDEVTGVPPTRVTKNDVLSTVVNTSLVKVEKDVAVKTVVGEIVDVITSVDGTLTTVVVDPAVPVVDVVREVTAVVIVDVTSVLIVVKLRERVEIVTVAVDVELNWIDVKLLTVVVDVMVV